ncbi:MAG: hypothetical protein RLZZ214_3208 [Verrucomicrobiota bacterium]|jgi:hypothetical protein
MSLTANSESPSQVPLKWSSKHPLYLESEVEMDESKLRFIPYKLTQLQVAIKTDMKGILAKISQYAANDTSMDWLTDGDEPGKIQYRIATALKYVHIDAETDEDADVTDSYQYGHDLILELALKKVEGTQETDNAIHSCMIALISKGRVQQAFELARLAGALKSSSPRGGVFTRAKAIPMAKNGSPRQLDDGLAQEKAISREQNQYKTLIALQRILNNGEVPTKRALCCEAFGVEREKVTKVGVPRMEKAAFSKILSGMEIAKALPDEPRGGNSKLTGTTYKFDLKHGPSDSPKGDKVERHLRGADAPIIWDAPLSPYAELSRLTALDCHFVKRRGNIYRLAKVRVHLLGGGNGFHRIGSIVPGIPIQRRKPLISPDTDSLSPPDTYFDRNLTRIKEALGLVYHALLLQFQMLEPTKPCELDTFVEKLSLMGLELGWARKRKMAWNLRRMSPPPSESA